MRASRTLCCPKPPKLSRPILPGAINLAFAQSHILCSYHSHLSRTDVSTSTAYKQDTILHVPAYRGIAARGTNNHHRMRVHHWGSQIYRARGHTASDYTSSWYPTTAACRHHMLPPLDTPRCKLASWGYRHNVRTRLGHGGPRLTGIACTTADQGKNCRLAPSTAP